jgi:hypothetical protein
MRLIGRIIIIIFAVFLASIAAGIAIAMGLLGPQWHAFSGDAGERVMFWFTAVMATGATGFTGAIGLLPLAILIAFAEAFKIRSLLVYAAAGAAMLALGYYGSALPYRYEESIDRPPPPMTHEGEIVAAAGVVFGLAYWLIAGRNAGRWRER